MIEPGLPSSSPAAADIFPWRTHTVTQPVQIHGILAILRRVQKTYKNMSITRKRVSEPRPIFSLFEC